MATTSTRERRAGGTEGRDAGTLARIVQIAAGAWLVISAFLLPHTAATSTNSVAVGALCILFALVALLAPDMRWLDLGLSGWLAFSSLFFYRLPAPTLWNNIIVALVVFLAALLPNRAIGRMGEPPRYVTP